MCVGGGRGSGTQEFAEIALGWEEKEFWLRLAPHCVSFPLRVSVSSFSEGHRTDSLEFCNSLPWFSLSSHADLVLGSGKDSILPGPTSTHPGARGSGVLPTSPYFPFLGASPGESPSAHLDISFRRSGTQSIFKCTLPPPVVLVRSGKNSHPICQGGELSTKRLEVVLQECRREPRGTGHSSRCEPSHPQFPPL